MKKICILCMLIFGLMTSVAFAAHKIDTERWFWVASNSELTTYIDKHNIKYNPDIDSCDLWTLSNIPAKNEYRIVHSVIYYKQNIIKSYDFAIYNSNNPQPISSGNQNGFIEPIIPNSIGEILKEKSLTLINRDEELAEYQKQQEAEAQQAEQERKDKEKEQRNKQIADTAIGIIGSLF